MDDRCPKCSSEKVGDSCPKCGLVFAKFAPSVLDEGVPEEIKSLWKAAKEDWENLELHAVFVEKALIAGEGGYAAACYRRLSADDEIAKGQLEKITSRLDQMMSQATSPQIGQKGRGRLVGIMALLFVLIVLALVFALFLAPGRI